jgi:hypothetical protein
MHSLCFCFTKVLFLFALISFVGCRDERSEMQIHVDLASLKETELAEKIYNDQKTAQQAAAEEKGKLEAEQQAAALRMEQERQATVLRLERERLAALSLAEKEKRDARRRAFDAELRQLASTSNRFDVLVSDLKARQGMLQEKLDTLPNEIASAEKDFCTLDSIMSGCMSVIVTNVRKKVGVFSSSTVPMETVIERQTLSSAEYVGVLKSHPQLQMILDRYNSQMVRRALDMVAENSAYENDRLNRELNEIKAGRSSFSSVQQSAYSYNSTIVRKLSSQLGDVDKSISEKERSLVNSRNLSAQNSLRAELIGLRREKMDLETKLSITKGQEKFGRASEVGVGRSFRSQEFSIKNEYEANLRESLNDARNIVLSVVASRQRELENDLEFASERYRALTIILDAHSNKNLTKDMKQTILEAESKKKTEEVMNAASVLWENN